MLPHQSINEQNTTLQIVIDIEECNLHDMYAYLTYWEFKL